MESNDIGTRVLVLEKEMQWAKGSVESIKSDLQDLKTGQNRILDLFLDFYREMGEFRVHTEERFSVLQARMDAQFVEVRKEMGDLQARNDAQFVEVQKEFAGVHQEIAGVHKEISGLHGAITSQTRWILAALLGAATLISLGLPVALQLAKRFL